MQPGTVRAAGPADYEAIRALTLQVYLGDGFATPAYEASLADVEGRARHTDLLVAVVDGQVIGSVALAWHGQPYAEITTGPDEAAFRMLVVSAGARGRGTGRALVQACIDRTRTAGARRIVISTEPEMHAAHRLYAAMGFRRDPARDWSPEPGIDLLCYLLDMT